MAIAAPPAVALTTASQPLHTGRDGFRQIVEVIVANVNAANPATLTLGWTDASVGNASSVFAFTDVAAKDGLISPRKVVEPGDKITGFASANGYLTASAQVVYEEPVT